jgi:Beta-propeller repeat
MLFFGWVDQLGSSRIDSGVDIAVDSDGSIFIAGDTEGNVGGTNAGASDVWFARYEQIPESGDEQEVWKTQIGTRQIDRTTGIAAVNGDIYLTGYTFGDLAKTNQGGSDVWLARYTTNDQNEAQEVWRLQPSELNNQNDDVATDIFVDADGNVYVTGTRTAQGLSSVWFAKYTANGGNAPIIDGSRKTISSGGNDVVYGITVDDEGNIYLAGATDGVLAEANQGSIDAWVAKYNSNGEPIWIRQLGSEGREEAKGIAVDGDGNVYITGYTSGTLGGDSNGNFNQDNIATGYIVQFGTSSNDDAFDLAIGNEGQIVVAGRTLGDIGTEDNDIDRSFDDIWLAEFIADSGENVTIRQYGSNSVDIAQSVAINGDDVFVAGTTYGTLTTNQDNAGLSDAFLVKYTFTEPEGGANDSNKKST